MFGEKENPDFEPEISAQHFQNHIFMGVNDALKSQYNWFCIIFGHILINIDKLFIHYTDLCFMTVHVSAKRFDTTKRPALYDFLWVGYAVYLP